MTFKELEVGALFKFEVDDKIYEKLDDEQARNINKMYIIKVCPGAKVRKVGD